MEKDELKAFHKPDELMPGYGRSPSNSPVKIPRSPIYKRPKSIYYLLLANAKTESRLINYRPPSTELITTTVEKSAYIEGIDPDLYLPQPKSSCINKRLFGILPDVIQEASEKEDLFEYKDVIVPPLYELRPHGNLTASGVHNSDYYFKLGFRYRTEGNLIKASKYY